MKEYIKGIFSKLFIQNMQPYIKTISEQAEIIEDLKNKLKSCENGLAAIHDTNKDYENRLTAMYDANKDYENRLIAMCDINKDYKNRITTMYDANKDYENRFTAMCNISVSSTKRIHALEAKLAVLAQLIEKANKDIEFEKDNLSGFKLESNENRERIIGTIHENKAELEHNIGKLNDEVNKRIDEVNNQKKQDIDKLNETNNQRRQDIDKLNEANNQRKQDIDKLNEANNQRKQDIDKLNEANNQRRQDIDKLNEKIVKENEFTKNITSSLELRIENKHSEIYRKINSDRNDVYYNMNYRIANATHPDIYRRALGDIYFDKLGERLNLDNPKSYNEKIQWLKLYDNLPIKSILADKYAVREWVKEKIGEEYLIPLLGIWESSKDIDLEILPKQFVLKPNHGSGWVMIVKNKDELNITAMHNRCNYWMRMNFAFCNGFELLYNNIPKKIIAEEYLENKDGELTDYKFWCFHGKVESVCVITNRSKGLSMAFYDKNWERLPYVYDHGRITEEIERPNKLQEMISIAEELSKDFIYVRVDLYLLNSGEIKFGEMTFTSASGFCKWDPPEYNYILGELITLPINKTVEVNE